MKKEFASNLVKWKNYCITHTKQHVRRWVIDPHKIQKRKDLNRQICERIKGQSSLQIAFVVVNENMWKFDVLFNKIREKENMQVEILVSPSTQMEYSQAEKEARRCYTYFKEKGYPSILCTLDTTTITRDIDVLFYCTPYDSLLLPYLRLENQKNALGLYSLYGYPLEEYKVWYDLTFHNLLYRYYLSYPQEIEVYKRLSRRHGSNGLVSGAPIYDHFIMKNRESPKDDSALPLFIIAPHHSIEPWGYSLSTFLTYYDAFLRIAKEFSSQARFVFKPHPMLKNKLYQHPNWGISKTDDYYNAWTTIPNCDLCESDYIDLFIRATALIHDCSAFTVEFQMLKKPALFLRKKGMLPPKLNTPGEIAFGLHDMADEAQDIREFVQRIIQDPNHDPKRASRDRFVEEYVQSPISNSTASDIILRDIESLLEKH